MCHPITTLCLLCTSTCGSCIVLMMSKRNHLIIIIKKGENVNVCIHDFEDAKDKRFSSLIQVKNSEILKITPKSHNSLKNNSWESHLFKRFLNDHQRPINRWLGTQNVREILQESFIAKCSLKRNSWANTCKSIKSFSMDFNCNILLFKRESFFLSSLSKRLIKGLRVS